MGYDRFAAGSARSAGIEHGGPTAFFHVAASGGSLPLLPIGYALRTSGLHGESHERRNA